MKKTSYASNANCGVVPVAGRDFYASVTGATGSHVAPPPLQTPSWSEGTNHSRIVRAQPALEKWRVESACVKAKLIKMSACMFKKKKKKNKSFNNHHSNTLVSKLRL